MVNSNEFRNPSAEFRIYPFWFWNGDMEEEQIEVQIAEMAEKGLGGFFLCARQGMTIPYLSDAWFGKVRYAVEAASRHGLSVWLYDEYPYPSGIAGGEVILEHPDAKHRILEHRSITAEGGQDIELELPWGRTVSVTAVPVNPQTGEKLWNRQLDLGSSIGNFQAEPVFQKTGLTDYNNKRFFTYRTVKKLRWKPPVGRWDIHVFVEAEIPDYKYYGTFVDFGHEEAVRTFIKLTHERYKQAVGQYFGSVIKGMFTDETGYLGRLPWSARLPRQFAKRNGYDLKPHLPALVCADYEGAAKVRYDFFQAANHLLRESYHKQCRDWCEANGIEYAAEVPAVRMTTQLYSHVVGSDSAHEKLGRSLEWIIDKYFGNFRGNPKMASSLARQLGRKRVLCECFHSTGWSMTLQDAKWMIDRMAAMGINFYNFHSFFYTLDGLAKHDAPPSQFLQNSYWKHFGELSEYAGRISYIMTQGSAVREIALLDPTTSLWTHLGNPIHATVKGFDYVGYDEREKSRLEQLKADWGQIGRELLLALTDYDHLDAEFLGCAEVRDGRLIIGSAQYSVLILPPVSNLESVAWKKIREFVRSGGTVIAVGLLPYEKIEQDGPSETEVMALFGLTESHRELYWQGSEGNRTLPSWFKGEYEAYFIPPSTSGKTDLSDRLKRLLDELYKPSVRLGEDSPARSFLMQVRAIEGNHVIFVCNQEGGLRETAMHVGERLIKDRDPQEVRVRRLNLETGGSEPIAFRRTADGWAVPLTFHPYESHLIEIGSFPDTDGSGPPEKPWEIRLDASGIWEVSAEQPNPIRFDSFHLSLHSEEGTPAGGKVDVKTFIDQCDDLAAHAGVNVPVAFDQFFGTPKKISLKYPVRCTYETEFIVEQLPQQCELFMDRGAISGDYAIFINGERLGSADFRARFVYDHANVACSIRPFLRIGVNRLTIEVTIRHDWDGVIDALYVRGDFGVRFAGQTAVITSPVTEAGLAGGPCTGYPYYAGTLSYKKLFDGGTAESAKTFSLTFSGWDPHFHECAELFVNGQRIGVRPWSPYRWIGDARVWKQGGNLVEIKVSQSLSGLLDGKYFDYAVHKLRDVRTLGQPARQGK